MRKQADKILIFLTWLLVVSISLLSHPVFVYAGLEGSAGVTELRVSDWRVPGSGAIIPAGQAGEIIPLATEYYFTWTFNEGLAIPDNNEVWTEFLCASDVVIPSGSRVSRVVVYHMISHDWVGDLQIELTNGNKTWTLHDHDGGSEDFIDETLTDSEIFVGEDPDKSWYYRIRDTAPQDTGTINTVVLTVYYQPAAPDISIEPMVLQLDCSSMILSVTEQSQQVEQMESVTNSDTKEYQADKIDAQIVTDGMARVIVSLAGPILKNHYTAGKIAADTYRGKVKAQRQVVLSDLQGRAGFELKEQYDNFPFFSARVDSESLKRLREHDAVIAIEPVMELRAHTKQGLALISGSDSRSQYDGSGLAIAICDTGVDYNHPLLGGGGFPNSKVIGGYDFGSGDNDPIPVGSAHGTACAGIAAGGIITMGDYIGGVAPGAKLYALKIAVDNSESMTSDTVLAAWDWCITHQYDDPENPIMVISNSFGGDAYTGNCDSFSPAITVAVQEARQAGITILASTGNDGYCDRISWPACISGVIAVGAVYDSEFSSASFCVEQDSCVAQADSTFGCDPAYFCRDSNANADMVTCYSNASANLDILAPSTNCYTTDISGSGGYSDGDYVTSFGGTSAACPYGAGAVAVLQAAAKVRTGSFLSVDQVRSVLAITGDLVQDDRSALTSPRINIGAALAYNANCAESFIITNNGQTMLSVNDISGPAWLSFIPDAPFELGAGMSITICVWSSCSEACQSWQEVSDQIIIRSNDPEESEKTLTVEMVCSKCPDRPQGDIDGNCVIDLADLARMAGQWLKCGIIPIDFCP